MHPSALCIGGVVASPREFATAEIDSLPLLYYLGFQSLRAVVTALHLPFHRVARDCGHDRAGVLNMAAKLSGTEKKPTELTGGSLSGTSSGSTSGSIEEEVDSADFDSEADEAPPEVVIAQKDPMIRRKIEDKLEQIRLREELGLYEDDEWRGI